jgi:hypothetical protein
MLAVHQKRSGIASYLIERWASINAENSAGTSILILAVKNCDENTARAD